MSNSHLQKNIFNNLTWKKRQIILFRLFSINCYWFKYQFQTSIQVTNLSEKSKHSGTFVTTDVIPFYGWPWRNSTRRSRLSPTVACVLVNYPRLSATISLQQCVYIFLSETPLAILSLKKISKCHFRASTKSENGRTMTFKISLLDTHFSIRFLLGA